MNQHKQNCQMSAMGWAGSVPPVCTCFENQPQGHSSVPQEKVPCLYGGTCTHQTCKHASGAAIVSPSKAESEGEKCDKKNCRKHVHWQKPVDDVLAEFNKNWEYWMTSASPKKQLQDFFLKEIGRAREDEREAVDMRSGYIAGRTAARKECGCPKCNI